MNEVDFPMRTARSAARRARGVLLVAIAFALTPVASAAQQTSVLPQPTNQDAFAPLALPDANGLRNGAGEPGRDYWQQRADYDIGVTLDPDEHRVTGSETITYTNHSPDALDFLWLQLDQNLFAEGSRGSMVNPSNRWRGAFAGGGFELTRVEVVRDGEATEPAYRIEDTTMRVDLDRALRARGGTLQLRIDWAFTVPEYGADRMGRIEGEDGWVYELAQWYPRMFVYDDVDGWNTLPYLGQGEFYLEYGNFNVEITVPRDFIVVATGELQNPDEVLTTTQRLRLERARESAETVHIVRPDEVGDADARPAGTGPLTWRFRAENVRDVAWAASSAFIWDAAGWEDVLVMSAYPKEGLGTEDEPGWEMSTRYARHSISYYSEQWFDYPYPVAINVGGIVGGMEYPMIVFCSVEAREQALFGVTDHEFGHSWYPMIVGSDERRHAWMDEGFNTFINHYSNLAYWGEDAARTARTSAAYVAAGMQSPIADQPIATHPDEIRRQGLGFLAYRKPGYGLILLREAVLGPERFDEAFRTYTRRWAFRHPQPADFFRTIEEVSGEDLDWFWRGWFHSTDVLDQAVDSVTVAESGRAAVHLSNHEGLVMPAILEVVFTDGATERLRVPVEAWARGDRIAVTVADGHGIERVRLDPDGLMPDIRPQNDMWRREPATADDGTESAGSADGAGGAASDETHRPH